MLVVCSLTLRLCTRQFANNRPLLHDLALPGSEVGTTLWLYWILGIDVGASTSSATSLDLFDLQKVTPAASILSSCQRSQPSGMSFPTTVGSCTVEPWQTSWQFAFLRSVS
jgi:hypothetical protein